MSTGGNGGQLRAVRLLAEMRELASFSAAEQRYIRRSLEVAWRGAKAAERWARGVQESANIADQARVYRDLDRLKVVLAADLEPQDTSTVLPALIKISAVDLGNGKLTSFAAYRFLYERLLGPAARPWLLGAFTAAAALPCMHPEFRAELFQSVSDAELKEAGWSNRAAAFFPEWVEKVPLGRL